MATPATTTSSPAPRAFPALRPGHAIAGRIHAESRRHRRPVRPAVRGVGVLGLRAGLTVSASIPIAVLAISVLKKLGGSTILENNIVQTIGSAGESVAGGVVFTIPALIS